MSTKSELKENVLATKLEVFTPWLLAHRVQILTAMGITIGAVLVGSVFIIRRNESRDIGWAQLSQAQILFNQKQQDTAINLLNQIQNSNPGTDQATYAKFYLGESNLTQKKFDDAVKNFSDLTSQLSASHPLRPLALSNLAFSHEQKGDFPTAVQTYQQFMSQYSEHYLAARVQLALGKAQLRSGDQEGARKSLGQLVDLYPTSPWAQIARRIMDKLETR